MPEPTIYHNPRCSKSRQTLQLLEDNGFQPKVVEYLNNPLDEKKISTLLKKLKVSVQDIVRSKEEEYKKLNLQAADDKTVLKALVKHPKLLERPIVELGQKAAIGRPPENVLEIL